MYLQFFTWIFVLYEKAVWTEWHLPTLQWQYGPSAMLCVAVVHSHCYQTSVNVGQHTVLLFLPLAFISAGETSTKHAVHTSGLSSSAHSRCRVNLWGGPDAIAPWFLFYTDLICKMAVEAVSLIPCCMDLLCSCVNADLRHLYLRDTSKGNWTFSLNSYEVKGQCLCKCQCV